MTNSISPSAQASVQAQTPMHKTHPAASSKVNPLARSSRLVVDAPVRVFHWLFAFSFLGSYLSAESENWRMLHVTLGYTVAGLLTFCVLYGLWGPPQARLSLMWRKLKPMGQWLSASQRLLSNAPTAPSHWRQGQNLLMALIIVALLVLIAPLSLSGYAAFNEWGDFLGGDWLEEVHEFLGETTWTLVLLHLALIVGLSLLRRKNLAQAMLSGSTEGPGPDLVKKKHTWLAVLMFAAVLAFWAWEWQHAPQGLIPSLSSDAWNSGTLPARNEADD